MTQERQFKVPEEDRQTMLGILRKVRILRSEFTLSATQQMSLDEATLRSMVLDNLGRAIGAAVLQQVPPQLEKPAGFLAAPNATFSVNVVAVSPQFLSHLVQQGYVLGVRRGQQGIELVEPAAANEEIGVNDAG